MTVKALTFDVYGTVVDWRSAILGEGGALRPSLDWAQLADAWRGLYRPTLDRVTRGELAWSPFDHLQRVMPDPRVYQGAAELLQCRPAEVMMVAAHAYDLRAARDVGLRTAFVVRPLEWGPRATAELPEPGEFDLVARDFMDLADQLAADVD